MGASLLVGYRAVNTYNNNSNNILNTYKDAGYWETNSRYGEIPRYNEKWHAETVQDGEGQPTSEFFKFVCWSLL